MSMEESMGEVEAFFSAQKISRPLDFEFAKKAGEKSEEEEGVHMRHTISWVLTIS